MVDLDDPDLHPIEHAERGHQVVTLVGVATHLLDADVGDLEAQQRGSDQGRSPQSLGDRRQLSHFGQDVVGGQRSRGANRPFEDSHQLALQGAMMSFGPLL
jgi:hypothetical protein